MERYQEVMVASAESALESAFSAPWLRTNDDVIYGWQWNLVISETMHGS